ncbi:pyrroline-5-carboxylate reductase [Candidatus Magnetaquicoccus inordinatus]|uniref:pyrroline-5-carboxylate reductase n=1 Tax=Candidatus Magnetaquicoccus inordinatus TaxID=2496818 RepID=UPI001292805F|nr:pyrroline-5-carboxylate reductase [Candidatus Magnetaquicoccus inordinatus]
MLQEIRIGFLGGGNMAAAMIAGLLQAGVTGGQLCVSEPVAERRQWLQEKFAISVVADNLSLMRLQPQVVILAVKPGKVGAVLQEIFAYWQKEQLLLSIAAGIELATLQQGVPEGQGVVRVMPNTPALIGEGIAALYAPAWLGQRERQWAHAIMAVTGEVVEIEDEGWMDGVTALSGSGPAYVYLIAEALSDGGVACGLPRAVADRLAIRTLIGSARLLDASGSHPGVLKNQVTSPGGTTIAALTRLETAGVRGALIEAVQAAWQRSRALRGHS